MHSIYRGSGAVYSIRAQAEIALGNLAKSLDDLSKAEQCEREAISGMAASAPELVKHQYVPTLKYMLTLESRALTGLGKSGEAAEKASESDKL